ncbi:hypothetical protein OX90_11250 [Pseudomonas coronafaciens pv. porri]|uniref:Uncharacterized protein n=1 Tax=Pseudomonas coronafaciens pv. porri TaxID=83964 RepID=A0ABR5JPJ4_9PSED|nr:hypothetical protein [Pseudomonas coronafaciens]KOP59451.1 hypothetical protein OX90_11250 [Pseudomonas coronafaciens pv. porri]
MTMTNAEISKRIKDSDLLNERAIIKKRDILEIVQWRIHNEHEHLAHVNSMVIELGGHEELKEKVDTVYYHVQSELHTDMVEWLEDDDNEFFLAGELISDNEFLMKIKLRANNSGNYFKDINGTATVLIKIDEDGSYTHDTFFVEEDIKLVEKQADIWLERLSKKYEQMVRFVKSLVSSHQENSSDGLHFNDFKTDSDKVELINKETNEILSTSFLELADELMYLDVDYQSKTILSKQEHQDIIERLIPTLQLS